MKELIIPFSFSLYILVVFFWFPPITLTVTKRNALLLAKLGWKGWYNKNRRQNDFSFCSRCVARNLQILWGRKMRNIYGAIISILYSYYWKGESMVLYLTSTTNDRSHRMLTCWWWICFVALSCMTSTTNPPIAWACSDILVTPQASKDGSAMDRSVVSWFSASHCMHTFWAKEIPRRQLTPVSHS